MTFANFILANIEQILKEWEEFARTIPAGTEMKHERLRDHAEQMLRVIAADMLSSQSDAEQKTKSRRLQTESTGPKGLEEDTAYELHASDRLDDGFPVDALVAEYRALRASVIRLWIREMRSADEATLYELTRFNEAIDEAIAEGVARYITRVDRSREMFLGILGHDLRTPLGAVLLSARYLLHSADALEKQHLKAVLRIERSGLRMQHMIADLLDAARVRLGGSIPITPQETNAESLCQDAIEESTAAHPDRTIRLSASGELSAYWDTERISQVLCNLIENAVKHGSPDGPVDVGVVSGAEVIIIRVHNMGTAISDADQKNIFEPMTQGERQSRERARDGLGLGLYIAHAITKAHGGSITVSSDETSGTVFSVTLPRVAST